eukprot:GILK01005127.1.p1 GENE.GILK01005127.1~~GILK01005127.1.p1  ORF type:complete len:241 (-),score=46.05 GILK01005127.1:532-1254(-)
MNRGTSIQSFHSPATTAPRPSSAASRTRPSSAPRVRPPPRTANVLNGKSQSVAAELQVLAEKLQEYQRELEQKADEKRKLIELIAQMKREINLTDGRCQALRRNHDRLHNETVRLEKKISGVRDSNFVVNNELKQVRKDVDRLEHERDHFRTEASAARQQEVEEASACETLQSIISRMKKELQVQLKERDHMKAEAMQAQRTAHHLHERIEGWASTNRVLLDTINGTISTVDEMPSSRLG